jgi:hypothetical protein
MSLPPTLRPSNENGPGNPEPFENVVLRHSVQFEYWSAKARSQVTVGRLSLRSLPDELLHRRENGPGGIRTRIYDLDRVSCEILAPLVKRGVSGT